MTAEQAQIIYQIGFPLLTIILLFSISLKQVLAKSNEEKLKNQLQRINKTAHDQLHNQFAAFLETIQTNSANHVNYVDDKFHEIGKNFENINEELEKSKRELAVFNDELKSLTNENHWLRAKIKNNQIAMTRHMQQITRLKDEKRKLQKMVENG